MYSSIQDVRNVLTPGGGANDNATGSAMSDEQIIDSINEADSIIDLYIRSRYVVDQDPGSPSVALPPVRYWSRNIAAWLVSLVHRRNKDIPPDEPIRLRYDRTMAFLQQVKDGTIDLVALTEELSPSNDEVFVFNQYEGYLFAPVDFGLSQDHRAVTIWRGGWPW